MSTTEEMPKYSFLRGTRVWVRLKRSDGTWKNTKTKYTLRSNMSPHQRATVLDEVRRYVRTMVQGIERRRTSDTPDLTILRVYAEHWLKDREARGIGAHVDERSRLEKYVYSELGDKALEEVRPHHVRDLVRKLKAKKDEDGNVQHAPRSVIHIFRTLHSVFNSALVEERIISNPCVLQPGELPKKVDVDPEWRVNATYTVHEVRSLISAGILPPERRVLNALKALAGLRHGEAAAICVRHIDSTTAPLKKLNIVRAYSSRSGDTKRVKTEIVRSVPIHPVLDRILHVWLTVFWERIHGRKPEPDDLIVPTRTMRPIAVKDANEAFKRDLDALKLRKEAGSRRDRGGHDLRSWFETRLIEDGADSLIVRRLTHAPPKDVNGGYERFSWETICREVSKFSIVLSDEEILPVVTSSLQAAKKAGARWTSVVTPSGLEADSSVDTSTRKQAFSDEKRAALAKPASIHERKSVTSAVTAARMLEKAALVGDIPRILEIAKQLRER